MDIGVDSGHPAEALSNFTPRTFWFDGVECASLEGPIQSFKQPDPEIQQQICKLVGCAAKKLGRKLKWQGSQTLWWKGAAFERDGERYQRLLDLLYYSVARDSASFREDLLATGREPLSHSIGKTLQSETVLTEGEFCARLEMMREILVDNDWTRYINQEIERISVELDLSVSGGEA